MAGGGAAGEPVDAAGQPRAARVPAAEMMLGRGKRGNVRVLSRPTVELMTTDHLTPDQKAVSPFFPAPFASGVRAVISNSFGNDSSDTISE